MNSKLVIIGLMFSSLLAIPASGLAQKTAQDVVLQDDKSGDHLIFVISTGQYKFESCQNDVSTSGFGSVTVTGCKIDLRDISDDRRVLAEVDLCQGVGKADIAFAGANIITGRSDSPGFESVISDSITRDSVFTCDLKTIEPK